MFQGRYGNDHFNQALSIFGLVIIAAQIIIGIFFPGSLFVRLLQLLWLGIIAFMLFRMFSRNFEARRRENEKFLLWWGPFQSKWRSRPPRARTAKHNPTFEERRQYKYFNCNQCAQRLRVPRGKGKLRVTCTRCGNKFEIKS